MKTWSMPTAFSKQRQIRVWKKHHLGSTQHPALLPVSQQPVFKANNNKKQRTQELDDFLNRLRDRN